MVPISKAFNYKRETEKIRGKIEKQQQKIEKKKKLIDAVSGELEKKVPETEPLIVSDIEGFLMRKLWNNISTSSCYNYGKCEINRQGNNDFQFI